MAHNSLRHHRKTMRMMRQLGISKPLVVGHMDLLWMTVQEQPGTDEDGIMRGWSDQDIADAAEFDGDATEFVRVLIDVGFVDVLGPDRAIHDYIRWIPAYLKERLRKRALRAEIVPRVSGTVQECPSRVPRVSAPVCTDVDVDVDVDVKKASASAKPSREKPPKLTSPKQADPLWDAVVAEWSLPIGTKPQRSRVGKVVVDLRSSKASPADLPIRRARMVKLWGAEADTPESLAKHWAKFCDEQRTLIPGQPSRAEQVARDKELAEAAAHVASPESVREQVKKYRDRMSGKPTGD